jgi:hypothetical protein
MLHIYNGEQLEAAGEGDSEAGEGEVLSYSPLL